MSTEAATGSVVVVGNPRPGSRTRGAAENVVHRLTGAAPGTVLELSELGSALFSPDDERVATAKRDVLGAELLVVASPTYKATYTGLLKAFLDQFGAGEIADTPTVALMLGGAPVHALAPELLLRPVLVEIGCSCPAPGLFLLDSQFDSGPALETWLTRAARSLPERVLAAGR